MRGPLSGVSRILPYKTLRQSSYDKTGGNMDCVRVDPGTTHTLAEVEGAGVITHIWITLSSKDPLYRRNLVIRMY